MPARTVLSDDHIRHAAAYDLTRLLTFLSLWNLSACLRILEEMEAAGVSPDYTSVRITLNALASGYRMQEVGQPPLPYQIMSTKRSKNGWINH